MIIIRIIAKFFWNNMAWGSKKVLKTINSVYLSQRNSAFSAFPNLYVYLLVLIPMIKVSFLSTLLCESSSYKVKPKQLGQSQNFAF